MMHDSLTCFPLPLRLARSGCGEPKPPSSLWGMTVYTAFVPYSCSCKYRGVQPCSPQVARADTYQGQAVATLLEALESSLEMVGARPAGNLVRPGSRGRVSALGLVQICSIWLVAVPQDCRHPCLSHRKAGTTLCCLAHSTGHNTPAELVRGGRGVRAGDCTLLRAAHPGHVSGNGPVHLPGAGGPPLLHIYYLLSFLVC